MTGLQNCGTVDTLRNVFYGLTDLMSFQVTLAARPSFVILSVLLSFNYHLRFLVRVQNSSNYHFDLDGKYYLPKSNASGTS